MSLYEEIEKYVNQNLSAPDSHIYHYTKPNLGEDIIKSRIFRLSSHVDLNKKNNREFKIGPEIIKTKIKKTSLKNKVPLFDKYLDLFKGYIGSFCEESNYEYAKKQYGAFCLGFKKCYIQEYLIKNPSLMFGHVIYERNKQERVISEMIQLHEDYPNSYDRKLNDLILWLYIVIPFLKEERDHRDNESRIITGHIMDPEDPTRIVGVHCSTEITFNQNDIILPFAQK